MKVVICGAGQVGWQIARHLSHEENDVTIVDSNADLVRSAMDELDVKGVVGFASYPDVLKTAGTDDAEMIIAATHSDEVNMVTCQIAHSVFGVSRKVARLRAQSYLDAIHSGIYRSDHLPIDVVISPEKEVARAALSRLETPAAFETEFFMNGRAQLIGITIGADCPVTNTPLRQLSDLFSTLRATVVGIRRDGVLFAPNSGDQIFEGDSCYLVSHTEDIPRTLDIFGKETSDQDKMVIIGGGTIGLAVAQELESRGGRKRVRMIEINREIAEFAAETLEKTIVLNGDGLDAELLSEARVETAKAILAVTDDDKTNILSALRAKAMGCPQAICLINDPTLASMLQAIDIDAFINPRAATVSSILRHIRHGKLRNVYSVGNAEAEVIEAEVLSTSPITASRLRDIDFPEGVLVGAIEKNGEIMRPTGDTIISEGDVIILFALSNDVAEVERLLQVTLDFF